MRIDAVIGMGKQFVATRKYAPSCGRISFERKFRREIQVLNCKVNLIHWIFFFYLKTKSTVPFHIAFLFSRNSKKMFSDVLDGIYSGTVVRVVLHFRDFHFFWGFHLTQYSCMLPVVFCPSSAWLPFCVRCCGPSLFLFLRILDSECYEKPNFDIFRCEWLVPKFGLRHCDKVFHKVRRLILPFSCTVIYCKESWCCCRSAKDCTI